LALCHRPGHHRSVSERTPRPREKLYFRNRRLYTASYRNPRLPREDACLATNPTTRKNSLRPTKDADGSSSVRGAKQKCGRWYRKTIGPKHKRVPGFFYVFSYSVILRSRRISKSLKCKVESLKVNDFLLSTLHFRLLEIPILTINPIVEVSQHRDRRRSWC
jgi:hypothetical protein